MLEGDDLFQPISTRSLKDEFIERFEALILSGRLSPGEKVPSERELGELFGISRPVVHEGLRTLESRGLLTIESRKGVRVNDYRREGSIEMLLSMLNYSQGRLSAPLLDGILHMRVLFEVETARMAATQRTDGQLKALQTIIGREQNLTVANRQMPDVDYEFHLLVAIASGNPVYPLLLNSFKRIYHRILVEFYNATDVVAPIIAAHQRIVAAIERHDAESSATTMRELLAFSEENLRKLYTNDHGELG